ncbi:MAG: hypothetical protein K1566_17715 [Candidatus Thiodiazotropha sp. (ex. Lucinisca nassula)]|nr:hypothetical protein [Candidatus Thiodiazotropha sp. (ex. Lucinisca nassula)]MBW9271479.1 hypothetical protein [Candidatus Thiodiazotropha sp. (ex. Lucinisca nassula)]
MPFTRRFSEKHHFMLTTLSGELNDEDLLVHVLALNEETKGISDLIELADCTTVTCLEHLTVEGTSSIATLEAIRPDSLLALVVLDHPLNYGLARAYQAFSEDRRKEVRIFLDIDEALSWLVKDDQEFKFLTDFIKKHN